MWLAKRASSGSGVGLITEIGWVLVYYNITTKHVEFLSRRMGHMVINASLVTIIRAGYFIP